ncbi:PREDICTED: PGR5-like protein 1B, chloroplastic isoform X1 [Populus euphratica]|uniref:PGR5-like protein 1B, chloroplastic isoform X1 n=1 Tax=Populus euphratica TaxID=75702 RepID=A0AAJ6UU40_POPEU|nr:PREDICTED: PGR5-like protein 1B, chloroplastic isoform X1 [Populus euphratica]
MAGTCKFISRHVIELSTNNRASRTWGGGGGASFCWARISAMNSNGVSRTREVALSPEGPSCIFVGPIETASQETLEALYCQARDAYYSGKPLIVDDMFDRVELKLRWYGSKSVVKYPRCSLRRQSTYSDAEEDISQAFALASIWILFLTIGSSACAFPIIYTIGLAYQDAFGSGIANGSQAPIIRFLATVNGILFMAVGSLIGYPIASASVKVLQGLWRNDLVALKGACPNCGEEVFAFVKSDQSNNSPHRADCHVCESLLEFRTKVEVIDLLMPKLFLCFLFKELNMQVSIVRLTYFFRVS